MRKVDLFTQLLASTAIGGVKLADIHQKTARLPQSTLSFNKYTPLYLS